MASKGLRPLPKRRGSVLVNGGDRSGRVELPLARAAAVSTGLSILTLRLRTVHVRRSPEIAVGQGGGVLVIGVRLKARARGRVRRTPLGSRFERCVSIGPLGLGSGSGLALGLKVEPRVCRPGRRAAHTWFACACTYGLTTRTRRALCRPWSRPPAYRQSRRSPSRRTRRRKRGPPRRRRRTLAKAPDDTPHQRAASMAAAAAATTAAGSAVARAAAVAAEAAAAAPHPEGVAAGTVWEGASTAHTHTGGGVRSRSA